MIHVSFFFSPHRAKISPVVHPSIISITTPQSAQLSQYPPVSCGAESSQLMRGLPIAHTELKASAAQGPDANK